MRDAGEDESGFCGGMSEIESLEPEQDGRQSLAGLVVELPGKTAALDFLSGDDAAQRVARDAP